VSEDAGIEIVVQADEDETTWSPEEVKLERQTFNAPAQG
jgi:hypothetical protein